MLRRPRQSGSRRKLTPDAHERPMAKKSSDGDKAKPVKKPPAKKKSAPTPQANAGGHPALHALVIGCDFYLENSTPEGSYPSLHGCVRDATRVEKFLRERAGLTDDRLVRLTSTQGAAGSPVEPPDRRPTYENIVAGFRALTSRARPGDRVYIHYSGHGGRCPTIVPKVKGKEGLDEALVPIDIGNSAARYVRDVEVAKLLREMTDKGLVVTVVFDCCHSGGATRAVVRAEDQVGVRGVEFVDRTPRPVESLVGTPEELAAAVPPSGARAAEATRGMASTAGAGGTVVLAACRPSELAREFPFDGGDPQGALTYWFLTATAQADDGLTFRTAFDLIHARVHGQFPAQTPMLFGDPDRPILGGVSVPADPAVPVLAVAADGKAVTLKSGLAGLVQAGAEFAVYPIGSADRSDAARVAAVRVTMPGAAESAAAVTKQFGSRKVQVGDRAVPAGVAQRLVRRVRVIRPEGGSLGPADEPLRRVLAGFSGSGWVEPAAGTGDAADFLVTTTEAGDRYRICDPSGEEIVVRPELRTADPSSAGRLVARLAHLARFQALCQFDNPDPFSPLRGRIAVELFRAPLGFQQGDAPAKGAPFPAGRPARVAPGEWVVLSVTNRSAGVVNAVAFDLAPDWAVAVAHPEEPFHPIDGDGGVWLLPLLAGLPEGLEGGRTR